MFMFPSLFPFTISSVRSVKLVTDRQSRAPGCKVWPTWLCSRQNRSGLQAGPAVFSELVSRLVWCVSINLMTIGFRIWGSVFSSAALTSDAIWHYWTWSDLISGQIRSDVPQRGQIRSDLDQIRSNQDQVGSGQIRIRSDPIKIRSDQVRSDQIQWDQIRSGPMSKDLTWSWPDLTWSDLI